MTQIAGPGTTMTGGTVEEHEEPLVIDGSTTVYRVVKGTEDPDGKDTVIYEGSVLFEARNAFDQTDPGDGYVQLLENGEVDEAKRASTTAVVEAEEPKKPGEQGSAFDTKPFTAKKPEVDGVETDTMKVSFSGSWELDPMNADDVAFFNRLQRGQSLDLQVEVEITDRSAPYKRSAQTDEETISGIAKAKIVHVHRLTPEQL